MPERPDTSQLIRLPSMFWNDHADRALPTPEAVPPSNKRALWVRRDDPALPELLSDARYYADPYGPDGFACGSDDREGQLWGMRLKRSAKLTAEAIEAAFDIKRTEDIPTIKRKGRNMPKTKAKTKRKPKNLFAPDYPDHWTAADDDAACAEGWNIFEADGRGVLEIERIDCNDPPHENAPTFKYDDDAIEHVRIRALQGSELHARALAIHRKYRAEQLTVMVGPSSDGHGVTVAFFPEVDIEGDINDNNGDRENEATKTISRDDAFLVLEQLQAALGLTREGSDTVRSVRAGRRIKRRG